MKNLSNSVRLMGRLGADPEIKELENGSRVARFSVATSEIYRNPSGERVSETQWHQVTAWNKMAELSEKLLGKGSEVALEGKLVHGSYTGKDGQKKYYTEIVVREMMVLGRKEKHAEAAEV